MLGTSSVCTLHVQVRSIVAREAADCGAHMLTLELGVQELLQPEEIVLLVQRAVRKYG